MVDVPVLPITASDLGIRRSNRDLLSVPSLSLGELGCSAIVGPNGAGKTLLVRTLAGLQSPDKGTVTWCRRAPDRQRQHRVGMLLQRPVLLRRSAAANIVYALQTIGISGEFAKQTAAQALQQAGLASLANTPARQLSGGEQQRLCLARALALEPAMLFLDEPTASVDPVSTLPIEQMLGNAISRGLRVVLVSHDLGQVRRLADEVLLMHAGRIVERSRSADFFTRPTTREGRAFIAGELLI
jgi:tungstate transport system ATP-binding protein